MPRICVLVAALLCCGLVACGDDDDSGGADTQKQQKTTPTNTVAAFDVSEFEAQLKQTLAGPTSSGGPKVTSVDCPPDVEGGKGQSFKCEVAGRQGLGGTVTVTLKDDAGEAYDYKGKLKGSGFSQDVSGSATGR